MQELDAPPRPSIDDLHGTNSGRSEWCRTASDPRSVLESEIRLATSIPRLAELHQLWQVVIEELDGA